jgi:hypothetical protein
VRGRHRRRWRPSVWQLALILAVGTLVVAAAVFLL